LAEAERRVQELEKTRAQLIRVLEEAQADISAAIEALRKP
jgi:hypothetical protein